MAENNRVVNVDICAAHLNSNESSLSVVWSKRHELLKGFVDKWSVLWGWFQQGRGRSEQRSVGTDAAVLKLYEETQRVEGNPSQTELSASLGCVVLYIKYIIKINKNIIRIFLWFTRRMISLIDVILLCSSLKFEQCVFICTWVCVLDVMHTLHTLNFQTFNKVLWEFEFRGLLSRKLSAIHKRK